MRYSIVFAVVLGIVGLIVGYFLFAKFGNGYIALERIVGLNDSGLLNKIGNSAIGLSKIRLNILLSGGVGAGIGFVLGLLKR